MKYVLSEDWKDIAEIVVFGAGTIMRNNFDALRKFFSIQTIIDNDCKKWGTSYLDVPIKSLSEAAEEVKGKKIVITATESTAKEIGKTLIQYGFVENEDYCSLERFVAEWFWRYQNKIVLLEVHTTITTRCTLQCKNCNMFMPYYKKHTDYPFDEVKNDIDLLFKKVDYIFTYQFLGGEPLLHPELGKIITYIGEHYGNQIGTIGITTNGTLVPTEDLLQASQKYGVMYHISDYSDTVQYKDKLNRVLSCLRENHIKNKQNSSLSWLDFGFPDNPCHFEKDRIRDHMLSCGPIFHGVNDGKLFYCHVAWSANKAGLFHLPPSDYIDLNELSLEKRESILEHCLGDISTGHLMLCSVCGGCGKDNHNTVCAAVQKSN